MALLSLSLDDPLTSGTFYLAYWRSTEIKWYLLLRSDRWMLCIIADGRVHQVFAGEISLHKSAASRELVPPQMPAA